MKKILKWIFCALLVGFTLLQFTNPARTNPPVVQDMLATNAPLPHITAMLHAACYDCHSNETKWPWYSRIAPMSWLVAHDVVEGREQLNLSEWPADNHARAAKRLESMSEIIGYGDMPPKKYTALHADARLRDVDRKELTNWLDTQAERLKASVEK